MNDLKGIIEDCNKSDLVSDKVIKKIIEIIGQEKWQDLHDENSDICTTMGELIITLEGIAEPEIQLAISEHDREHNDYELTEVYKKVAELEKEAEECMHNALFWLKLPISKENVKKGSSYILKLLEPREKRIAELEHQLTHRNCIDCSNHSSKLRMKTLELEEAKANLEYLLEGRDNEIDELKKENKVLAQNLEDTEICENGWKNRVRELEAQIEKMKKYIKACWVEENLNDYSSYITNTSDEFRDLVKELNDEVRNGR